VFPPGRNYDGPGGSFQTQTLFDSHSGPADD
jgi:hypothetical protein